MDAQKAGRNEEALKLLNEYQALSPGDEARYYRALAPEWLAAIKRPWRCGSAWRITGNVKFSWPRGLFWWDWSGAQAI
jgi:hypothetical protein